MVVTAATETAFPALMKQLMDKGFKEVPTFPVWWVPVIILLIFIVRGIAGFVSTYAMEWVANNVLRDIRQQLFDKLIELPASSFDARSGGQLISKLIAEVQMVLLAATNVVTVLIRDSLILLGLICWLFWINWKLTLIVIFLMPMLAFVTNRFSKRIRRVSRSYLASIGRMTSAVEEVISGNRVIKIYGGQDYESKKFANENATFRSQSLKVTLASAFHTPINQLIAAIGVAIVVTIALSETQSGNSSAGDFVSFLTAMLLMFSPLKHLAEINGQLQRGLAAAEGVFSLLDENAEEDLGTVVEERVVGNIDFRKVTFKYPTRETNALVDFNLTIPAGKTYAIVGPSGSGKSTLVNLIPRIYDIQAGTIEIDGKNIKDFDLKTLRKQISFVSQDVTLFNDTIGRNIAYGRDNVTYDEIKSAVAAADLGEFISTLPLGLDTVVGDRGVRVSGGQRQRIAIARAILKNAPILLLDEATSALDTKSESSVQNAIEKLRVGRTTIVVAHRLSTVVDADRIIVMQAGRIVQQGKHTELIAVSGVYKTLYSQMTDL